ncbi:yqeH [Symbiodinium pilosum]|uniref:YqeH protein n=1 Tax=Symbiodinium pilosum TaxID=2952 RepID=A0A812QEF4_SYMPI|nr:yqeH [Symbiodinium pilosum]
MDLLLCRQDQSQPDDKPEDFCKKGKRVEVLAPSKRWREAQVIKVGGGIARVHYMGYDSMFDEDVPLDQGRLRSFGQLRAQRLKDRQEGFVLQLEAGCCPGCGVRLQCTDKMALGYIPPDKMVHEEEADDESKPLNAEDEVALLMKEDGAMERNSFELPGKSAQRDFKVVANVFLDIRKEPDVNAERTGESLAFGEQFQVSEIVRSADSRTYFRLSDGRGWVFDRGCVRGAMTQLVAPVTDGLSAKKLARESRQSVCMRCWGLWQYNDCDDILRPAYGGSQVQASDELTSEAFEKLLSKTLEPVTEASIFAVVDVFDFGPSFTLLEYVARELEGKPKVRVRIIANKIDLLPPDTSRPRLRGWVAREAHRAGHSKIKIMDVYPISCHTGEGVKAVSEILEQNNAPGEHYVVGAANAGKSSLLNRLALRKRRGVGRVAAEDQRGFVVSVLPGTTLRPITMKFQLGNTKLVDMPGLLVPGSMAERLTLEDLKVITPQKKEALRLTFHMDEGRTLLLGALARIDFVKGRPFQLTVFISERVKIHRTRIEKAARICKEWAGERLIPPVDPRRYDSLLPWESHQFSFTGTGWDEACADVVFPGLGWVSITGCGDCVVEAHAPAGVQVTAREPLMPHEARWTGVKYRGFPGWYKINGRSTRGFDAGKAGRARARKYIKGRF